MNFLAKAAVGLILLGGMATVRADDHSVVWPTPKMPAGENPAVFPRPRLDWLDRFGGILAGAKGQEIDFILDGDSITDFWRTNGREVYGERLAKYHPYDFGISGDRTENLLWRLQAGQVDGLKPKLVMLMIGTNNLGHATDDQIVQGITQIVHEYETRCPDAHLLLLGIFPRSASAVDPARAAIKEINEKISHLGDSDAKVTYLDIGAKFLTADGTLTPEIMPDFLHPSAAGYKIWADAVQPVLDKYLPAK